MQDRLQKILSARGIASRRKAEEYIEQGLVKVNGKVATLGQKADPDVDEITVDGTVLEARQEMLYYVLYKPRGVVTSNAELSRDGVKVKTIPDLLPANLRSKIYPIGRLDKDSEGLLLLTNDGVLAFRLTHPKFDHEKEYDVQTAAPMTDGQFEKIRKGITLFGTKTKPAIVTRLGPAAFRIALTEGRNRQIRRMVQKVGGEVTVLKRVRIMTFTDNKMKAGELRPLNEKEKTQLLQSVGV
jgi:23S rRNA pseudouridine2605 synthase/23S rRNA pseudouridine2604 synthase